MARAATVGGGLTTRCRFEIQRSLVQRISKSPMLTTKLPGSVSTSIQSPLRVRNYPALEEPPAPGQLRAGAHSDYGSLTILKAEDKAGGLQVRNQAGAWVDVPILADCFIVNLGDLMARWTNDYWVSTLHRVVNPPMELAPLSRRQSLVFFHNPNYDASIECIPSCQGPANPPKYSVTTSGEHLRSQFVRTQTNGVTPS